jgi:energy-coupling factor transporter ATP-binding protein EcfA2
MHIDDFISRLKTRRKTATGAQCHCPAHNDDNASLSVSIGTNGNIVVRCHAGCSIDSVVSAMGLKLSDLFQTDLPSKKIYTGTVKKYTRFPYFDANGIYQYDSVRIDIPGEKKTFCIMVGDKKGFNGVTPIIYNLHLIQAAITKSELIFLPEGEKHCDFLYKRWGITATCNPNGAGKWKDEYSECLTWANVVILPDNDAPGREHSIKVAESLKNCTKTLRILELPDLPEKGDIEEWVAAGGTKEKLIELAASAPLYETVKKNDKIEFYYDSGRKEYLYKNKRKWLLLDEGKFKMNLIDLGYKKTKPRLEKMSEVEFKILDIRENHDVDYVGGLAGYKAGFYQLGDQRLLITHGPKIIYSKPGNCDLVMQIIDNLLNDEEDETGKQLHYFLCWLKIAYESLVNGDFRPGQVIVLAGPAGCGKSLLQKIITEMLGGRSARPYKYMTEQTEFNGDLFSAEHLPIEDEMPSTDIRSRRAFGSKIKEMAANEGIKCRAMHREGIELKPFWRVSISVNDEPENLLTLPPIDESLEAKMIILRAFKKPMPMPTAKTEDRKKFWNTILSQLPAFAHFLTTSIIPEDMVDQRYGVGFYHNRYILNEINQLSPEKRLLDLIDMGLFAKDEMSIVNEYELSAHELESKLHENSKTHNETGKLLTWTTTCGTYLGRLAKKYPDRVKAARDGKDRVWIIKRGE